MVVWLSALWNPAPVSARPGPGGPVSKIDILISWEYGNDAMWEAIARNLIQLKEGDAYGPPLLEGAVSRLYESNLFESIHLPDPVHTPSGVKLNFELVPFSRIKDIRIYKAFPLFKSEVLNVMTIYTGDVFSQDKLDDQASRVRSLFQKQGYLDPKVTVEAQKNSYDGGYVVSVAVEKGEFFRIRKVVFKGNDHFSSARLKLRLKTWKASLVFGSGSRFIRRDMEDDVKNLISFYRKKGFAEVRVTAKVIDGEKENRVILFNVEEGPLYQIGFTGNSNTWDFTLKKEITLKKDGNKNNFALRKSVRNIERKYEEKGFGDVKVGSRLEPGEKPLEKPVVIEVEEGPLYRVSGIKIKGNSFFPEKRIRENILTRKPGLFSKGIYVPKILEEDINAVRALYLREGFAKTLVEHKVVTLEGSDSLKMVEISLSIEEGPRTIVENVHFKGLSSLDPGEAMAVVSLKPNQPFRPYMVESDVKNLEQKISELGYPNCRVVPGTVFTPDNKGVTLTYGIEEGGFVSLGQVFYVGNFRTKTDVLDDEMEILPGQPLVLTKLLESRKNMLDVNALNSVRFKTVGLEDNNPEVDLIVGVEEKKPYFFEAGTGYDTERHFYFNSKIGDNNFLGRNLAAQLEGEISQIGYKGDLSLTNPRVFSSRIGSNTRVFGEEREEFNKDFGTRTAGVSQKFYKEYFSKKLMANLGLMYETRSQYQTDGGVLKAEEEEDYEPRHVVVVSPGLMYHSTDSYVRPTKGWISTAEVDLSRGIDSNLDDFVKYRLDARYYYSLLDPLVIAFRGRYHFVQPYGDNDRVPGDQLFFLGGTASVRGFEENLLRFDQEGNAVGGREAILGSVEARYDLGLNFEFTVFYDVGAVRQGQGQGGLDDFRDSAGLGLRYMTPVGPMGFLYGWKLDQMPQESSGVLHFSLGYTF